MSMADNRVCVCGMAMSDHCTLYGCGNPTESVNHTCVHHGDCDQMIASRDRAICEQARIIAGLRQQIDELLSGCGSNSCKVQRPHGQGNSGPCRCVEKLRAAIGLE